MYISLSWIKEFTELPSIGLDEIAYDYTMGVAEVEDIIQSEEFLNEIFVGQIQSIRKHPEADKLNLVTVSYGKKTIEVVCGASNVRENLKIAYAPVGVTLPIGLTLEPKKIRGFLSEGMICSLEELAMSDSSEGIWELDENAQLGSSLSEYLDQKSDTLFDIDNKSLTHRPDLWGHYGQAREFAAVFNSKLKKPYDSNWKAKLEANFSSDKSPLVPRIEEGTSCLTYWGLSLDGVEVKESPGWMQKRLNDLGMRPINNIVDISNYVMLELGIPLHIFDRESIKGDLIIDQAKEGEKFTTLDEIERTLESYDTMIKDSEKALVLAGVMGGANSGVKENTKSIFIEVANWKDHKVRKTSTRLGLRTESSQRYEKSLDSSLCYRTLLRTMELVLDLCPGAKVIGKAEVSGIEAQKPEALSIKTSFEKINNTLGTELENDYIQSVFESLDFKIKSLNPLELEVPSYRSTKDIEGEADLIEEIGRTIGFDNIKEVAPNAPIKPVRLEPARALHRKIQDFLSNQSRSLEIMTHPLVGEKLLKKAQWENLNDELKLVNALSLEADRMRPSLIPSALQACHLNSKNFDSFSFFEIGRSYLSDKENFSRENHHLLVALYSRKENQFIQAIETAESLLDYIKLPYQLTDQAGKFKNSILPENWDGIHPHEALHVRLMGKLDGAIFSLHPLMMRKFKIKGNLSFICLNLGGFENRAIKAKSTYKALSKFPSSTFDCAIEAEMDTKVEDILNIVRKIKQKEIKNVKISDVFKLDNGKKSITVRTILSDESKTLENEVIKTCEAKIVDSLSKAGFPLKQG